MLNELIKYVQYAHDLQEDLNTKENIKINFSNKNFTGLVY